MDTDKNRVNRNILAQASREFHHAPVARERRAFPRHIVEGRADIVLVKGGLALRGNIMNLSLSGCRIRCDERFKVGIYTRVEIEFYLEGMAFLLAGVLQAIHSPYEVGIRFLDLSPRKLKQVQQLICELEEIIPAPPVDSVAPSEAGC
jgi:hypothetical protein